MIKPTSTVSSTLENAYYSLAFPGTGLPSGTIWHVNITGHDSIAITGTSYSLSMSNGTCIYTFFTSDHE
ncbi:MAG: hypothetical protein M1496_02570 [Candidatus Thermoplasmatota archaeon]|nr:hypothetical protein [Candidatus Thermoplasmatota archaeon]